MVFSKIDKTINYLENNIVDSNDIDYETVVYNGRIFNKDIKFVLGKPNFEYIKKNIVYFFIYLINLNNVTAKIGIYEIDNSLYYNSLDIDGFIIIEKLNNPLLFSYSKTYIINKYNIDKEIESDIESEDEDEKDSKSDIDSASDSENDSDSDSDSDSESNTDKTSQEKKIEEENFEDALKYEIIKEQTKKESDYEMATYKSKDNDIWVNKFLKSNKYSLQKNEGGGDCFFAVLRDGLKQADPKKYNLLSVKSIREKLSEEVDSIIFDNYKELYGFYLTEMRETKEKLLKMKKIHGGFKKIFGGMTSHEKSELLLKAKTNVEAISKTSDKSREIKDIIEDFEFMKDIKTIDDLKTVIKTSKYWADAWAISTLERLYNVKFIILAKDYFVKGEIDNVLQCGEIDKKLQEMGYFDPEYYILTSYDIDFHYELITYDKNINKTAFKFKGLPYRIKELILEKCMEKNSGPFYLIKEFRSFAEKNTVKLIDPKPEIESLISKPKNDLYDDNIVIQIYNKSLDKKVGEGSGESIKSKELKISDNVIKLNKIKDWRKKLDDNFIMDDYKIKGKEFLSVQHYMYASRFYNIQDIFTKFEKNSGHEAGKSIDGAKKFYESILKDKMFKEKIISDDDYKKDKYIYLLDALKSKFSIEEFKEILYLTGNAKINIFKPGRGGGAEEATTLMKIRKIIN